MQISLGVSIKRFTSQFFVSYEIFIHFNWLFIRRRVAELQTWQNFNDRES